MNTSQCTEVIRYSVPADNVALSYIFAIVVVFLISNMIQAGMYTMLVKDSQVLIANTMRITVGGDAAKSEVEKPDEQLEEVCSSVSSS
jgi:hypothetical protein